MLDKKPWTMMVYLAADNNLFTFGVDSLRQMKAAAGESVNILAEFDTGPMDSVKRYAFDGRRPIGPIGEDVKQRFGPTDAADPDNLASFIEWGATHYPAEHYFVVIWGHGGGVDDDFPRQPDNSFVPRHGLLSLFKGTGSDFPKGTGSDFPKGTGSDFPKGTGSDFPKGTASAQAASVLTASLQELLKAPLGEIGDILSIGDDALHRAVIEALRDGITHALSQEVLSEVQNLGGDADKPGFQGDRQKQLEELQKKILELLATTSKPQDGHFSFLPAGLLSSLQRGILDSLKAGVLYELQRAVLSALKEEDTHKAAERIRNDALDAIFRFLENTMLELQKSGVLNVLQNHIAPLNKSLAFVDHPESFLSNTGLKRALRLATERIGHKIDILGMDSCNMNMIEIGYELRDSVNFLVASQDEVPDASWPYDRIIAELVHNPDVLPEQLAKRVVTNYIEAYSDYAQAPVEPGKPANLDEPVALSVLDLGRAQRFVPLICDLVMKLKSVMSTLMGRTAIFAARQRVRSFSQNQFIDLVQLCDELTKAPGDPRLARSAEDIPVDPINRDIKELTGIANSLLGPLRDCIFKRDFSMGDEDCNGTSIYFPEYDPIEAPHEKRLGKLYQQLDFDKVTNWSTFVTEFLRYQKQAVEVAKALANPPSTKGAISAEFERELEVAKNASTQAAEKLHALAQMSKTTASPVNGAFDGAALISKAIASQVDSVIAHTRNGHGHEKRHPVEAHPPGNQKQ